MQKLFVILTFVGFLAGCNSAATQTRETLTDQLYQFAESELQMLEKRWVVLKL